MAAKEAKDAAPTAPASAMKEIEVVYELANPKGIERVDRVLNTYKRKGSIENFTINEEEHKINMRTSLTEPDVCKILKTCTKKVDVVKRDADPAAGAEAEEKK